MDGTILDSHRWISKCQIKTLENLGITLPRGISERNVMDSLNGILRMFNPLDVAI